MATKGWGYGTIPHITLVSEEDGTFTLYDGVSRMEDLDFADATSAIEDEAMQPGGARLYLLKSSQCIEYWQSFKEAFALDKNDPRQSEILLAYQLKWSKINKQTPPTVLLSDIGL